MFLMVFTFASCENFIGGDINKDPNNPTSVPVSAQMPALTIALADNYGGMFSRFCSMLTQQVEGVARQWTSFNQYTGLAPNRFDSAWNNHYENTVNEIKIARTTAVDGGLNYYVGILDITEAFALMMATDVWDDMPYSEAFNGIATSSPAFDSQASIYDVIYTRLDSGLSSLAGAPGPATPGGDDVIYGGNTALWAKAAHAIKARGLLHQDNYSGAMAEAEMSFDSPSENMAFQYPDANNAGGWYRFNRDRTGDIEFHPTLRGIMTALQDTNRLKEIDQIFITDHTYMVPDFNQELITYREMQFVIAECAFRTGDSEKAHAAYLEGIKASFGRMGAAGYDEYIAQSDVDPGAGNLTLEQIMTQKYIAMFLQPEVYSDYRRTNIPELEPVSGSNVPVRWDYSSNEYLFNSNLTEGSVNMFTDRVGWNR